MSREAFGDPPESREPPQVCPLQGGLSNAELLAAWQRKLPKVGPSERDMTAFAVGVEVGFERARTLERQDWSRVHHALAKHGEHPGRTDDHLADVIDRMVARMFAEKTAAQIELEWMREALFRLWPAVEKAMAGLVFTADRAGEVQADMNTLREYSKTSHPDYPCRHDGRCQYAIDSGAEGLGHCPRGKCVMPEGAPEVEPSCKTPAGCAENGCLGWCDAHKPEAAKP